VQKRPKKLFSDSLPVNPLKQIRWPVQYTHNELSRRKQRGIFKSNERPKGGELNLMLKISVF
jgi:hypothetical protein